MCSVTCTARTLSFLDLPRKGKEGLDTQYAESGSSLHSNSSCEFEFGIIASGLEHISSSADELFANGMILPFQIQSESLAAKMESKSEAEAAVPLPLLISIPSPPPFQKQSESFTARRASKSEADAAVPLPLLIPVPSCPMWDDDDRKIERTEEIVSIPSKSGSDQEKLQSWCFWGFRRSTSLDPDRCCTKKSSVFPSQLLSRSKSTGSVPAPRRSSSHRRQASLIPKIPYTSSSNSSSMSSLTAKRASKSESEAAVPIPFLTPLPSPVTCSGDDKKIERTEEIATAPSRSGSDQEKLQSWSFWGFRRSTSLNSGDRCTNKSSVLPSQFLPRSKSTGSVPATRRPSSHRRQASHAPKPSRSTSTSHSYPLLQKIPPSKKSNVLGPSYGRMVQVSPVLNLPTLCISKGAANFFSLGCFTVKEKKGTKYD